MSSPPPLPISPSSAAAPRTHVGPFLLLGLDKNPDREAIEAGWAQRLIWARKNLIKVPLEDVNWAREQLADSVRRLQADVASVNLDTTDGVLKRLRERFQNMQGNACGLIDVERSLTDYVPAIELPDPAEVRQQITLPELPREIPAVAVMLEEFATIKVDAWEW